jgi:hypothetical protein
MEIAMTVARIGLAGTALLTVLTSAAFAEQGVVTKIDRLNRMISIQPTQPAQSGTVGANAGAAADPAQDFKAQERMSLDDVHAGDRVSYSATGEGTPRTITKLEVMR